MFKRSGRDARRLFDVYDAVRIVNLVRRGDRRREMVGELRRLGVGEDARVAFFPAVAPDNALPWGSRGERGCYLSHLAILTAAREAGQSVLILEDDCDFTDEAFASDWGHGADIFYGGFSATDYSNLQASNIQGSHCMGFSATILPRLTSFLEALAETEEPPPIDGAYVSFRKAHPEIRTSFALPQVAVQRQSPSDIAVGRFDRLPLLAPLARVARKLNRRRYRRLKMMEGVNTSGERSNV